VVFPYAPPAKNSDNSVPQYFDYGIWPYREESVFETLFESKHKHKRRRRRRRRRRKVYSKLTQ